MKRLSVVIPTLNEKDNLATSVEKILKQEKDLPGYKIEVVITDSHSTDGTAELAAKLAKQNSQVHYLDVDKGIGVALITGHQYALEKIKPDVLAQMDADGQVDWSIIPKLVKTIEEGYDLVLGSRLVKGGVNKLSFRRKFFTDASSWVCRIGMGPWAIKEFTNSTRAFTPELFKKINLERLPWKEKGTFINQPAFLHEAVVAGAKYKEIPLVFKDRAEGYSKNKTFDYSYDLISYVIDARLRELGFNFNYFRWSRKAKLFLKFGTVGFTGTIIDFIFYKFFIAQFGILPAIAKICSSEIAVVNNFTLNNAWTFKERKTKTKLWQRFLIFNAVSAGGILMAGLIVGTLHTLYGDGFVHFGPIKLAFNTLYFLATVPPVMTWNFAFNHFVTWRHKGEAVNVV